MTIQETQRYKEYKDMPITCIDDNFTHEIFSEKEKETLLDVLCEQGKYTNGHLITMTHAHGTL